MEIGEIDMKVRETIRKWVKLGETDMKPGETDMEIGEIDMKPGEIEVKQ